MRAAIYARVSGSRQEQEQTIASQLELLRNHVNDHGWALDERHVYADDGVSGSRLDRPALDSLRDAVAEGQVDVVVFTCPDRLARSYVHQWVLLEEIKKHSVEVAFINRPISGTPEDQLLLHVQGAVAEYERAKIFERTRRGRLYKARQGEMLTWGTPPFGYRYVRHSDRRGGRAEINEVESAWVRKMFDWLLADHLPLAQIARRLTEAGVPCRKARHWYSGSVRAILLNPVYVGRAYYNRREYVHEAVERSPGRGQGERLRMRFRPSDEWIEMRVPVIMDEATFRRAQEQLRKNKLLSPRRTQPGRYLLRGLVRCAKCNRRMRGFRNGKYVYYRCTSVSDLWGTCTLAPCTQKNVPADALDAFVWNHLRELVTDPTMLNEQLKIERETTTPQAAAFDQQIDRVKREVTSQNRRMERLMELYEEGLVEKETYKERSEVLRTKLAALEKEIESFGRLREDAAHQARLLEGAEAFRSAVRNGIENATFEERQRLCRLLIERVEIETDEIVVKHILPVTSHIAQ